MDNIALNFVPLLKQNNRLTVYRKPVPDTSQTKNIEDIRVRLPEQNEDNDWPFFDVSLFEQDGYKAYEFEYTQNSILTVHLIYQEFLKILNAQDDSLEYYVPQKTIATKAVYFVTEKFDEGSTEIIVKPYCLKIKKELGFLVRHKFALKNDQPFNKQTQIRSYSLDRFGRPNIYFYKDKKSNIKIFIKNTLCPLLSCSNIGIDAEFSFLPAKQLNVKTYLVGGNKKAKSQFMGIRSNGPYRRMDDDIRYLFLFTERTRSLARDIYLGLIGKLFPGHFSGLEPMFAIPIHKEIVGHHLVNSFDADAIRTTEDCVQRLKTSFPSSKLMLVAVLPEGFKGPEAPFDAYNHLKLLALRNNVYCQVVTEDTFFRRDQLKWSISNIGLQIFSKLGGAPWLVQPAKTNCLIFGFGSVQERIHGNTIRYTAYTVCLDSSGDFKYIKPLSSSNNETTYLDSLQLNLKEILASELGDDYKSLVLHLPYKISRSEINVVKAVVSQIREAEEYEVIVIRVNTRHGFVGFSDHNTCVPYESTYIQISKDEFLVWADGLQYEKEILHKRVPEPLYVNFIESQEERATKRECLQDILNLSGANWRGFNSKAQPISILYSRLIARFMKQFSHLDNFNDINIVSAESRAPWFL